MVRDGMRERNMLQEQNDDDSDSDENDNQ